MEKTKFIGLIAITITLISMFSMINNVYAYDYVTESQLYYYASQLEIDVYRWQNNQWVYWETRDLKYQDSNSWYARKFIFTQGAVYNPPLLKPNGKYYNETWAKCSQLVIGMESGYWFPSEYGTFDHDDLIVCIAGNKAPNGKYMIFIDVMMGNGGNRLKVRYAPKGVIFDYRGWDNGDQQKIAQEFGWCFYDSLFPEYEIPMDGGWIPQAESDYSYWEGSIYPIPDYYTTWRTGLSYYALTENGWQWGYNRFYLQRRIFNDNKWYVKQLHSSHYQNDPNNPTYQYYKQILGTEDHPDPNQGVGDNYVDVILIAVTEYIKQDNGRWLVKITYDMIQITGAYNKKIYWKDADGVWHLIFRGYENNNQRFAYKIELDSFYLDEDPYIP